MFEDLASNKYFVIALIIAVIVLIYLYSQKKSCGIEKMENIDLTPQSHNLSEKPWAESASDTYKRVNNKFDLNADATTKAKLGHDVNYIQRADQSWQNYFDTNNEIKRGSNRSIPQPLDDRPDLSQCQPCVCPKPNKWRKYISDDSDDSEDSDGDYEYIVRKKKQPKKLKK